MIESKEEGNGRGISTSFRKTAIAALAISLPAALEIAAEEILATS